MNYIATTISTAFCLGMLLGSIANASVPLRRNIYRIQPDSTPITLRQEGNGHFTFCTSLDGYALAKNAEGYWCYAKIENGNITASTTIANNPDKRAPQEVAYASRYGIKAGNAYSIMASYRNAKTSGAIAIKTMASTTDGLGEYKKTALGVMPSIGSPLVPVIMVEFPDKKFQQTTTQGLLSAQLNDEGYTDNEGSVGSVKDYFEDQSLNMFSPRFDVVGKVTMSKGYAYYGANGDNGRTDVNCPELINEAVALAKAQGVDFSKYASDGTLPLITIYYAGTGENVANEEGYENYIWPHFFETSKISDAVGDGITLRSYLVTNELIYEYDQSGLIPTVAHQMGIGTYCHEFGHALGLPDFYNSVSDDEVKTPDYWSVMDYGSFFFNGYVPVGYTAYEKSFMGWLDIKKMPETAGVYSLYPEGSNGRPNAYVIKSSQDENEYFILENRQTSKWYPKVLGSGMLISHVYYDANKWIGNTVNTDAERPCFTIVPADGKWQSHDNKASWADYKGDLYPVTSGNSEFSDESIPPSAIYSAPDGKLGKPIYNISLDSESKVITFAYLDKEATGIGHATATSTDTPATAYGIDGRLVAKGMAKYIHKKLHKGIYIIATPDGQSRKLTIE